MITLLFLLSAASAKVLVWNENSNWGNLANWKSSRLPCAPETVQFDIPDKQKGAKFEVRVDVNVTLKGLRLPTGAKLKFAQGIKIKFSLTTKCQGSAKKNGSIQNFVGLLPHLWNCPKNWKASNGDMADSSPCGSDTVKFLPGNSYSWIELQSQVRIGEIDWKGTKIQSLKDIPLKDQYFIKRSAGASLTADSACLVGQPNRCACGQDYCSLYPTLQPRATLSPTAASTSVQSTKCTGSLCPSPSPTGPICQPGDPTCVSIKQTTGGTSIWPIIAGVVAGVVVLILIIIILILCQRQRKYQTATKEKFSGKAEYRADTAGNPTAAVRVNPSYNVKGFDGIENPVYFPEDTNKNETFAAFDEDGLPLTQN